MMWLLRTSRLSKTSLIQMTPRPGVADRLLWKLAGPFAGALPKPEIRVAVVLLRVEVEQVVVDLDAVADELDRVAVLEPVVVDVEGCAALRHRPAGVLGDRDGAVADVVVDLTSSSFSNGNSIEKLTSMVL